MAVKLQDNVVFGLHTGEMKHRISGRDADNIKASLGLKPSEKVAGYTGLYRSGITEITICEQEQKHQDKTTGEWRSKLIYTLQMRINFARALGMGNYCLMPCTAANMNKVIPAISKTLKRIGLDGGNKDFSEWTVERVDSAFDILEEHTGRLMSALNQNLNIEASGRKKLAITTQVENESVRFGNHSYTWNVYVKYTELMKEIADKQERGVPVTDDEIEEAKKMAGTLRLERQNLPGAVKVLLPNRRVADLALPEVRENILQTMVDEIGLLFGLGDFAMPAETAHVCGIGTIQGIHTRIAAIQPRQNIKRPYRDFPAGHLAADGRMHGNIPTYSWIQTEEEHGIKKWNEMIDSIGGRDTQYMPNKVRHTVSKAGKTIEEYERKVLDGLKDVYQRNYVALLLETKREEQKPDDTGSRDNIRLNIEETREYRIYETCEKSLDAIRRFGKQAQTPDIREEVKRVLDFDLQVLPMIGEYYSAVLFGR